MPPGDEPPAREGSAQQFLDWLKGASDALDISFDAVGGVLFEESDDWSFIVKAHALVETAVSEIILTASTERRVKPLLEHLSRHAIVHKLNYVRDLNLLDEGRIQFARVLGTLRNHAVHDVRNLKFSCAEYLAAKPNLRADMARTAAQFGGKSGPAQELAAQALAERNPRFLIALAVGYILLGAGLTRDRARLETEYGELTQRIATLALQEIGATRGAQS